MGFMMTKNGRVEEWPLSVDLSLNRKPRIRIPLTCEFFDKQEVRSPFVEFRFICRIILPPDNGKEDVKGKEVDAELLAWKPSGAEEEIVHRGASVFSVFFSR